MKFKPFVTQCLVLMLFVFSSTAGAQDNTVSFENDIKPILESHCIRCHGPEKEEVFRIDDRETVLDYIFGGEPDQSELYTCLITDDEDELMPPPDDGGPLEQANISLVKNWIAQGANWPEGITLTASTQTVADTDTESANEKKEMAEESNAIYNAIGSLHPAAVHLPIGLLMAAGLFALLALRGNFVMSDCAYYCLWLGAIGAIIACVTGWWFGPMAHYQPVESFDHVINQRLVEEDGTGQTDKLYMHRLTGIIAAIAAFVLALFAASARAKDPDDGIMWKLGAIVLAAGIGYVAHESGELSWGENHYKDLKGLVAPLVDQVKGTADPDSDDEDEPAVGETSDESNPAIELEGSLNTSTGG